LFEEFGIFDSWQFAYVCMYTCLFYAVAFGQPVDYMWGHWPIIWQLEDALRASIRQCNNVHNGKKTNLEHCGGPYPDFTLSYVCANKHVYRYNSCNRFTMLKYNSCHSENFRNLYTEKIYIHICILKLNVWKLDCS